MISVYLADALSRKWTRFVSGCDQVAITFGIFVAYLADYAFSSTAHGWRWMFALGAVPGIALAVAMLTVPHTPRWLIEHQRSDMRAAH